MRHSRNLVLITGATGHVGASTLLHLLHAGYHVRAAVRSEAKAAAVAARPQIRSMHPGSRLTFTIVPDITLPGAYDDAVEGVTHIIHIASPLASGADTIALGRHHQHFTQPAVQGTLNVLEAANTVGTVRRIVITSSIVALVPIEELEGRRRRHPSTPVTPDDRVPCVAGPCHSEFAAYAASKVAALHHAEAWMERERPAFDVVHLHPGFVLGRNDSAATPAQAMQGTNGVVLALLLGKKFGPYIGVTVCVEDVARAHVASLDLGVPGGQGYILGAPACWNDARDIARGEFAEAVRSHLLIMDGTVETIPLPIDTSLTDETFGFRFASYADQVRGTVRHFLDLRLRKKKSVTDPAHALSGSLASQDVFVGVRAAAC
ncbi:hypothetical protein B0H67DRAFT_650022 [Lasiosphaeris hirsuta]|uniref:Ketoreductase domain-containing protein n=1 Tax=Lasiosphaeris hirsuta TaxID=260670 RepID=A0AA39ZY05_9PEZI|nr:hypothetical protein B0H67DRAFT_650022 [Lasiosphaeris hirsuta]